MPSLVFAAPWLLAAAIALPALYLLLRLVPPPARRARLPSLKLLGTRDDAPPPAGRPPWWLTALRLGAVTALLLGLAGPTLRPADTAAPPRRLVLVIDNGWTAAAMWPRIEAAALARLDALRLAATRVAILATAPPPGGWPRGEPQAPRFTDVATARAAVQALRPQPWPGDRAAVARALPAGAAALWIADGIADAGASRLRHALSGGEVQIVAPATYALTLAGRSSSGWTARIVRTPAAPEAGELVARDASGSVLARASIAFAPGTDSATARLDLDPAGRTRVARLETQPGGHTGAVLLADADSGRPRVLLVEGARQGEAAPLESAAFYVRRALEPHAEIVRTTLDAAARDPGQLLVLVDAPVAPGAMAQALLRRVRAGAVVVSFAGPRLAENGSALSPVPLRAGARALGGVLSWQAPQRIAGAAAGTPLAGMPMPSEAVVARQILAGSEAPSVMRWAWLADGTPLVSARREGAGLLILVHTAAEPGWSTLPLTATLEAMLRRFLPLASNPQALDIAPVKPFVLTAMLGADGHLGAPPVRARIAPAQWPAAVASASTPPGLYRSGDTVRPLNLSLGPGFRFQPLDTTGLRAAAAAKRPIDIATPLTTLALLLIAADAFVALALRGALLRTAAIVALLAMSYPAEAQQAAVQLGYVRTGDLGRDQASAAGLAGLGEVLRLRTAVAPGPPMAVNPARDSLGRFPLLYWPVRRGARMDAATAARVRDYLGRGGLILFDIIGHDPGGEAARGLIGPLGLPPLAELGPKHVLSRTFYLLARLPSATWVEAGTEGASGRVSGVVISRTDWATAWRADSPQPYAAREQAWRFGVNLVMYALTGTYKADSVHTRNLLERMKGDVAR